MSGIYRQLSIIVTTLIVLIPVAGQSDSASAHSWLGVPQHQQEYSLSCEFASLYMVTTYWGTPIYESDSLAITPWDANPHAGFRGDITGDWGNTWDYGIYAEPLADIASYYGYHADVSYDPSVSALTNYLDAAIPVIVWLSVRYEPGWYEWDETGTAYRLVPFEHVMVAMGYDDDGVYISDPGTGAYDFLTWDYFLQTWSLMDGMMLAVYPE